MRSEWKEVRLGDVIEFNPKVNLSKGISARKVAMEQVQPFTKFVSQFRTESFSGGSKFRNGDTIMARITPCLENGKTALIDFLSNYEVGFGSTEFIVWRNVPTLTDAEYVYYLATSPELRRTAIKSMVGSSGRQRVQQNVLEEFIISLPSLPEQRAIAATLSCLDDKIELNNKICANLEAQVQAIFKSWFVDFEPFQDGEFVDSELGPIPKNWRVDTLGNVTTEAKSRVKDTLCPVLSAVKEGELVLSEEYFTKQVYSKEINKYIKVDKNAFAYNPSRVNIGSLGMNKFDFTGCVSPIYVVFSVENGYHFFFDLFFKSPIFKRYSEILSSGSVRQSMKYSDFSLIRIIYPSKDVIEEFNSLYVSIITAINDNHEQSRTLAALRDALLPKLMSGDIEVPVEV